jgi:hypothetical protein
MFGPDHYVPVLRGKAAEFRALGSTTDAVKDGITPFIELPPISWDADEDGDSDAPDPSIQKLARKIGAQWDRNRPFFLEVGLLPSDPAIGGGIHPVEYVFGELRDAELEAIPVTGPSRDEDFQAAVAAVVSTDQRGVCVRLDSDDFDDAGAAIEEADELLSQFEVDRDEADLFLDFGEVSADQIGPMALAAEAVINAIPGIDEWRTLTWAGTAFPSVQNYEADSTNTAPRGEWSIWRSLRGKSLPRTPSFADYTVNGVQSDYDVDARVYRSSPNLRYTGGDDFVIWKARHPRYGHEQFNAICASMIRRSDFAGAGYSEGDAYIARCAADEDGPGMSIQWRQAGVSHHLAAVVNQIASLPEP